MFPLRIVSTIYVDVFRGVPLILVIFAIGFGVPALNLAFVSTQSAAVYGVAALVLSYSAYVSEVYRAGLNSVHQSQVAAARSLGLSQPAALRYVILPQAVRNIIPPLLNDFISLQKDTALVGILGAIEANKAAEIFSDTVFNYSSYVVAAILFLHPHDPAGPVHRPPDRPGPAPPPGRGRPRDARSARRGCPPAVQIEGLRKSFGDQPGAGRDRPQRGLARGDLPHRGVRLGQVDAAALHQPARAARRRADPALGAGHHPAGHRPEPGPPERGHRVPGLQPVPAHDRAAQRHAGPGQGARRVPAARPSRRPGRCWSGSGCWTSRATTRTGSPAASSSGWRSSGPWPCGRG